MAKQKMYKGLRVETTPPVGYIPLTEFAERCNVGKSLISQYKDSGKFNRSHICWVLKPGSKTHLLFFDWVMIGPPFIMSRPHHKWPAGFKPPYAKPEAYELEDPVVGPNAPANRKPAKSEAEYMTLDALKRRKEELAIEKVELELQKARNEMIERTEVHNTMQNIASLIVKTHETLAIRIGPMFASEIDPDKISKVYKKEVQKLLEEIQQDIKQYAS